MTVARLVRTWGNQGELAAEPQTDDVGLFERLREVDVWDGAAHREPLRVARARRHGNRLILKFEGIDTIERAATLAGWEVQIPALDRPAAPEGRHYVADLLGCRVVEAGSGRALGEVSDVLEMGAAPLLHVKGGDREILIPFASSICREIDTEQGIIRVELPEGLEELNPH